MRIYISKFLTLDTVGYKERFKALMGHFFYFNLEQKFIRVGIICVEWGEY